MPSSGKKAVAAGFRGWRRRAVVAAALAISVLPPAGVSHANWLSDVFRGKNASNTSKTSKPPRHAGTPARAAAAKPHRARHASAAPVAAKPDRPIATICDPAKFRILLDVGHTAKSEGAISARNVPEFSFNLRLAQRIEEKLKEAGFAATRLLVTEGKAKSSLVRRVAVANSLPADLFLAIHHDSVPNKLLENWEFEGKKLHFSDRFSGYSVWVSRNNPEFKTSLSFAELLAGEMKAQGLEYAHQYTQPIMGHYQHPILNEQTGVYSFDQLVVLRTTRMPAVLLEAGSIINRDEEVKMDSAERRDVIGGAVAAAMKKFCDARPPSHPDVVAKGSSHEHPAESPKPEAASR